MHVIDGGSTKRPPKRQILRVALQNCKNSTVKHSMKNVCYSLHGFVYNILSMVVVKSSTQSCRIPINSVFFFGKQIQYK